MNPSNNKKRSAPGTLKRPRIRSGASRQAVEALVEEQTLLRTLMDSLPDAIYFKDAESRFIQINQSQALRFGLKDPTEAIGKTDFDYFSEEHSRAAYEDEQAIIRSGKPLVGKEEKETWTDGRVGWVSTTKMPLRNQIGKIIGTFGISRDITKSKKLYEELKLSEEKFSKAFYASPNLMAITRPEDGLIIEINDSFCSFFGYQPEECIGHTTSELRMWAKPEQRISALRMVGETGAALGMNIDLRTKSGDIRTVIDSFIFLTFRNQQYLLSVATDITERKRAEEKLQESEARYRSLFENSIDGVLLTHPDGNILSANPAACEMLGRSEEEICQIGRSGVIDTSDPHFHAALVERTQTGKFKGELGLIRKDGTKFAAEVSSSIFKDQYGIERTSMFIRDIAERKQAVEALQESEQRYHRLFEDAVLGIFQSTAEGKVITVNPAFARMFGYNSPQEVIETINDVATAIYADPSRRVEVVQKIIDSDEPVIVENLYRRKNGEVFTGILHAWLVRGAPRKNEFLEGFVEDITERKRAEEALKEERNLLRTLVDTVPDFVYVKDIQGRKIVSNQADWQASGGKTMEDILGKTDFDTYPVELAERFWADDKFVIETGTPVINREEPGQDEQGNLTWILTTKVPFRDSQGQIVGLVGVGRNIAERKRSQEALQKSAEEYHYVINTSLDGFARLDPAGRFLDVNEAYCQLLRYSRTELLEMNIRDVEAIQSETETARRMERILENGKDLFEARLRCKEGAVIDVEVNVVYQPSEKQFISFSHDITRRKRVDEALRENENKYHSLFENAPVGILLVSTAGVILEVNPAALQILGSPSAEATKSINLLTYQPLIAAGMTADFQKCLDTGQPINVEHPYTSKWGKSIHVHIQCMPVFSEKKDVERIQVILEDVTERKQAEATVRQRLSELEFLYQSGLGLGQILEPEEVAQKIIDQMEKQLHWHHCAIRLYDADSQSLKVIGVSAPGLENEIDRQGLEEHFDSLIQTVGEGLTGKAVELGQTLRINDLKSDPHYVESFPGLNSGLYVPIQLNNRVIGVITVENEQQGAFSLSDERLVDILANQVAIALENSRLHRETLQQLKQLRSLRSIDLAITSSLDLNVTLDILIHQAMQQLIVDAIAVFLLQPDINSLKHASSQGFQTNLLEDLKWVSLADDSLLGLAVMERHILNSQCVQEPHIHLRRIWKNEGFYSMISIPLLSKGELKGVMGIFFRAEGNNPTKPQMDFIETLAGQAAIAIENVQLFDGLHKTNMELAIAYDATIEGWSRAMDLRDKETEGHTKRVVEMTMKMASYFGFAGEALMQIRRGALLHDIGKLGVPDRILLKPDKLTEDEWAIMRKHPAFAFEMLSPIHYLNQAISIPYCHHEKWDGTGYPRGLSGERIPLEARIFAVVDVWDALTSDRPYRKAWSREEVIEYIRSLSGSHFDPQVVDRFMLEISHENK